MAISICMVEQLGLAMILSFCVITRAFISGTIRGISFSIRHADELSMTTVPTWAKTGAHSLDTAAPAEKRAISGAASTASITLTTFTGFPLKVISLPVDRSEAA